MGSLVSRPKRRKKGQKQAFSGRRHRASNLPSRARSAEKSGRRADWVANEKRKIWRKFGLVGSWGAPP